MISYRHEEDLKDHNSKLLSEKDEKIHSVVEELKGHKYEYFVVSATKNLCSQYTTEQER